MLENGAAVLAEEQVNRVQGRGRSSVIPGGEESEGKSRLDCPGRIRKQTLTARLEWKGGKGMKNGRKGGSQGES